MAKAVLRLVARLGLGLPIVLAGLAWQPGPGYTEDVGPAASAPAPAQPAAGYDLPPASQLILMIRGSLLTLNDALQTGNYTVLRDVAAPGFRDANSAAKLAMVFSKLAAKQVDLSGIAVMTPKLAGAPTVDPKTNRLYVKGVFESQPANLAFELLYEPVNGKWRVFGIAVNTEPGAVAMNEPAVPAVPAAVAPAKTVSKKSKKSPQAPAAALPAQPAQ